MAYDFTNPANNVVTPFPTGGGENMPSIIKDLNNALRDPPRSLHELIATSRLDDADIDWVSLGNFLVQQYFAEYPPIGVHFAKLMNEGRLQEATTHLPPFGIDMVNECGGSLGKDGYLLRTFAATYARSDRMIDELPTPDPRTRNKESEDGDVVDELIGDSSDV